MMLLAAPGRVAAQATAPSIDELIAKAERQGALRVIVELKIDPQGTPDRAAIAEAQDRVLTELSGTNHRALRHFTTVPFIALEVSPDALRRLSQSPRVIGIREDRQRAPLTPGSP